MTYSVIVEVHRSRGGLGLLPQVPKGMCGRAERKHILTHSARSFDTCNKHCLFAAMKGGPTPSVFPSEWSSLRLATLNLNGNKWVRVQAKLR